MTDGDLGRIGIRVVSLLQRSDFNRIENEFEYALSHGRPAGKAIEEDLNRAIVESGNIGSLDEEKIELKVSHFGSNASQLRSLVECYCQFSEGGGILVELILPESGGVYIEDITSYRSSREHIQSELDNA